jgi:hypothetical protein
MLAIESLEANWDLFFFFLKNKFYSTFWGLYNWHPKYNINVLTLYLSRKDILALDKTWFIKHKLYGSIDTLLVTFGL